MPISTWLGAGIALLLLGNTAFSQQLKLGKNPYTVQKSAVLELNSDNQGLLLVRISDTTQINALAPPDGMIIFFTPTKQLLVRSNGYWQPLVVGGAISSLNGLTGSTQTFAAGTAGTDFTISSAGAIHTFNLPDASATARGVITTGTQTIAGSKTFSSGANPLTLLGVQAGTSTSADSLLTITSGVVRKLPMSTFTPAGNFWTLGGNTVGSVQNLGSIDNYDLPFITNNTEKMRLTSTGSLGIGTTTPGTPLHVMASNGNLLYLQTLTGGGSGTANILFKTYTGTANPTAQIGVTDDGSYSSHIIFSTKVPGADANALAERVRISSTGNVGIGTTTPSQKMDVKGTIVSSATTYPNYAYNSANRMAFGESNVPANETGSVVQFGSGANTRNMLFAFTKTNVNTSYLGNDGTQMMLGSESTIPITFRTGLVYTSANVMASGTEVMRLTSAGQLGIGTTTPSSALHVVGTNPLTLVGVQAGTSTSADSLLTITSGVVRKLPMSTFTPAGNFWTLGGNTVTTAKNLGTIDNNDLPFITNNTEKMRLSATGNLGVGATTFDGTNPEKLLVNAGTTSSVNAIVGKGNINNYLQLNIQNQNAGTNASSDVVATADNGTETVNYVDLGINSSVNTAGVMGGANDAYLYTTGNNFLVGTATAAKSLVFMTGGTTQASNERMRIDGSGKVGIGTTTPSTVLHVVGTNPLTLTGVQAGTSTSADSLLTITSGLVRKLPVSTFATPITTGNLTETGSGILTITGGTNAVVGSGTSIQVKQAGAAQNGFLSSTDWNTFNNKLATIDTTNISNFYLKVRAEHTAGAGISYNNTTGVIANSGVLSVNGNTGALTMDTGYISNFYLKVRAEHTAGAGISYNNTTGVISNAGVLSVNGNTGALTMDTGYISNFYLKTRSLFSAGAGISYNNATGVISASGTSIGSLNGLTGSTQTFATGTSGSDFNISSSGTTHTFNIPDASATARGLVTTGAQAIAGAKTFSSAPLFSSLTTGSVPFIGTGGLLSQNNAAFFWDATNSRLGIGTNTPASDFSLSQGSGASTSRGFRFTGNAISGTSNGTGFAITLGYNVPGNKQLWLGDADYLGNSSGTYVRYSSSGGNTIFDAVAGDNSVRRPIGIGVGGDPLSAVILGSDGSSTAPGSYVWANGNMAIGSSFRSNSAPTNGLIVQGNTGIGTATFDGANPEKFLVNAGTTSSVNAIVGRGSTNNYLQLNIQNQSSGTSASSDVVATADNGTESINYVDMGINSSTYSTTGILGGANNGYLYSTGNDFVIGNQTAGKAQIFFTTGAAGSTERMRIDSGGSVGIATTTPNTSTKLDVSGSVKLGAKGTAEKNVISFVVSFASNTTVPAASMNILASTYSPGALDYSATIPAGNTPTTTQGSVSISTDQDLPANVSIAWSRVSATSTVKVHFLNGSTSNQTIPSGLKLYITITEF